MRMKVRVRRRTDPDLPLNLILRTCHSATMAHVAEVRRALYIPVYDVRMDGSGQGTTGYGVRRLSATNIEVPTAVVLIVPNTMRNHGRVSWVRDTNYTLTVSAEKRG